MSKPCNQGGRLPGGVDLEIIETGETNRDDLVAPNKVVINGQEILVPEDTTIEVSPMSGKDLVTVRLSMFVRTLSVRSEATPLKETTWVFENQGIRPVEELA